MNGNRSALVAAMALAALGLAGCATGKLEARREQQQALVRELATECEHGQKLACAKAEGEKRVLYEVYGCHCKDHMPPEHKPVWDDAHPDG